MSDEQHPLKHAKHVFRAFLALAAAIVALLLGRSAFVPKSYGAYGSYRGDNVAEQMARPVRHGGDISCSDCHGDELGKHDKGKHAAVRCEVCHAPLASHIKDGDMVGPMKVRKTRELCLYCHLQLEARPKTFPQIQPKPHVEKMGGTWSETACFDCHDPHAPTPK